MMGPLPRPTILPAVLVSLLVIVALGGGAPLAARQADGPITWGQPFSGCSHVSPSRAN